MTNIDELKDELEALREDLENFEINQDDYEEQYCEMLDEISTVEIGSLSYNPSTVLREVDPTAYRCGLNDYVDSLDIADSEEYQELEETIIGLENEIEGLEEDE